MMKTAQIRTHITDDLGNDVVAPSQMDEEYDALCAVAEAAEQEHRAHCRQLTTNCPICQALAELDRVQRQQQQCAAHQN
jgi:hypothetical protein